MLTDVTTTTDKTTVSQADVTINSAGMKEVMLTDVIIKRHFELIRTTTIDVTINDVMWRRHTD